MRLVVLWLVLGRLVIRLVFRPFLLLAFLLLSLFQFLLLLVVSLLELLELLLLSLVDLLLALLLALLFSVLQSRFLPFLNLSLLGLLALLLALLVSVFLSRSLPLLNLRLLDLLALLWLVLFDSLPSGILRIVLLNLLLLLDLFLLDLLTLLILFLAELVELLLVLLVELRVDVVRPGVIRARRRRTVVVGPRITRPARVTWSVATIARGVSRVCWRIHGLVRRIPRNGIVHRGRAIVVVSIVSIIARVAPDIARIIRRVGRVIRRVVRRTIGLNASRRARLDRRGNPYVGTRLLIVLDPCSTHLRNSRRHAAIGLNHLLLLRKGNRRWRRSSPRYNRTAHCSGRRAHARFHTGAEHAALLGSNGRSGRINLRRLNFPAINLHHVSVDRLRRCKCFV